jgi:hypothetical protein
VRDEVEKRKKEERIISLLRRKKTLSPEARSFGGSRWENECDTTLVSALAVLVLSV